MLKTSIGFSPSLAQGEQERKGVTARIGVEFHNEKRSATAAQDNGDGPAFTDFGLLTSTALRGSNTEALAPLTNWRDADESSPLDTAVELTGRSFAGTCQERDSNYRVVTGAQ